MSGKQGRAPRGAFGEGNQSNDRAPVMRDSRGNVPEGLTDEDIEVCDSTKTPYAVYAQRKQTLERIRAQGAPVQSARVPGPMAHATQQVVTLDDEDREVCRITGTSEAAYLERKKFEAAQKAAGFSGQETDPGGGQLVIGQPTGKLGQVAVHASGSLPPPRQSVAPQPERPESIQLDADDLEVLRVTGVDAGAYLERRRFDAQLKARGMNPNTTNTGRPVL